MSKIQDALARKQNQNPQFDFMFRVEMPDLVADRTLSASSGASGAFGGAFESIDAANPFQSLSGPLGGFGSITNLLGVSAMTGGGMQNTVDEISHRIWSVEAPFTTYETLKSTDKDTFWYRAGPSDIGNITMTIDEMEDGATLQYLLDWQKLIDNGGNGTRNPPIAYKRNIKVIRLNAAKMDAHIHLYKGYYPIEISPSSFSNDSNGVLQYNVQFSGDSVEHIMIPSGEILNQISQNQDDILSSIRSSSITSYGSLYEMGANILKNPRLMRNIVDTATSFF